MGNFPINGETTDPNGLKLFLEILKQNLLFYESRNQALISILNSPMG